jgi:hypothetical protein
MLGPSNLADQRGIVAHAPAVDGGIVAVGTECALSALGLQTQQKDADDDC